MLNSRTLENIKTADLSDVMDNPKKYGVPTFEEYARNRDKWIGKHDDQFAWIDKGTTILKKRISTQKYSIFGYRADSLEECERIANAEGCNISQLEIKPELTQDSAGQLILNVRMEKKIVIAS
jgi:hypothetical protein